MFFHISNEGALPPWSVEEVPTLIRSMYLALSSDCNKLIQTLSVSTKVTASTPILSLSSGELLAGRYLDVSHHHIESFLHQTKEVCTKGMFSTTLASQFSIPTFNLHGIIIQVIGTS